MTNIALMNDDFVTKNKEFFYLAFAVAGLISFFPLFFTGFATADDFHYYLVTRRGQVMADSSLFAEIAGRFYFYIVKPVYSLPYIYDNMAVVKIFHFVPLIACFLLFAQIVRKMTHSVVSAWLFLLVFLMTMQVSQHTSLFVAYPFYFTFSFALLLISFLLLLQYFDQPRYRTLVIAAIFFAIGLLFYETYILFLLFTAMTIVAHNIKVHPNRVQAIRKSLVQFAPFLVAGILYLAAYFLYRVYHPSQYTGTSFSARDVTAGNFFMVLWHLSFSSFPLTIYETAHNVFWDKSELIKGYNPILLNMLLSAHVEWLAKGAIISFVGYKLLMNTPGVNIRKLLAGSAGALLLIFLPHLPLALTEKYIVHAGMGTMIGYVTTFFSFFGTLLLITLLLGFLMNLFNFSKWVKRIVAGVFVFGFFICSVLTDFSNYTIAKDIGRANLRFYAIDELLKTDEFKAIPAGTPFYAREWWYNPSYSARGITEQEFNWYEYFEGKNGVTYPVAREDAYFLDYSKKVPFAPYYLTMRQAEKSEDIVLVMAKMAPTQPQDSVVSHYADKATIVYYSTYKVFTLHFKLKSDTVHNIPIQVNHIKDEVIQDKSCEVNIYNTVKGTSATIFTLQIPGIDLNSIMISNMINPKNKFFYL